MTRAEFDGQMRRLVGLRFMPADLSTHFEGLRELPVPALAAAVGLSIRTRSDFPTPHELRMDADVAYRVAASSSAPVDRRLDHPVQIVIPPSSSTAGLTLTVTHAHEYACDRCSDAGWASSWCGGTPSNPWLPLYRCDRQGTHAEHEWTQTCPCASTNPTLLSRRAAVAVKYAKEPVKRDRY